MIEVSYLFKIFIFNFKFLYWAIFSVPKFYSSIIRTTYKLIWFFIQKDLIYLSFMSFYFNLYSLVLSIPNNYLRICWISIHFIHLLTKHKSFNFIKMSRKFYMLIYNNFLCNKFFSQHFFIAFILGFILFFLFYFKFLKILIHFLNYFLCLKFINIAIIRTWVQILSEIIYFYLIYLITMY